MSIRAETGFSLKDDLFNRDSVAQLSGSLTIAWADFPGRSFQRKVLKRFPELELKERVQWMVDCLGDALPTRWSQALAILRRALPEPLDPTLSDDDFGQFIWVVPGEYVARHGVQEKRLESSLKFLREATMRFSSELAIRPFLRAFPDETLAHVQRWATDKNYHVRRLASEGIRPLLPWALRVRVPTAQVVAVLDQLYQDPTRYVVRSVANNLNDVSKDDPALVLKTLKRWSQAPHPSAGEQAWLTRHALRTLVKQDDPRALTLLGYAKKPKVTLGPADCPEVVRVGETLRWAGELKSGKAQKLKVFLRVYFRNRQGGHAPRSFLLGDIEPAAGETRTLSKKVSFRPMTTRTLYPGDAHWEVVVNGVTVGRGNYTLQD
ncbi:MAG: DNA alkylation repair protein [Pseudomonadota bacterium]